MDAADRTNKKRRKHLFAMQAEKAMPLARNLNILSHFLACFGNDF